jgi:OOP family OmpA-OmpF porin
MKFFSWRWAWGLIPIAMLCWMALLTERGRIESDLQRRAAASLKEAGLSWAAPSFSGRDAVLSGQAADDAEPNLAASKVLQTWGVRVVDNRAELIEKADVYNWSASERDSKLRLTGFVPNDSTRKAIVGVAKATFPKSEVDDRMKLARGAPPRDTWLGGVSFALKQLVHMKNGTVELEGTDMTVAGHADDTTSYKSIKSALANNLPQGIRLKADRVTPPLVSPYTWSARLKKNQVQIGGHAPTEAARTQLSNDAKAAFPRSAIVDRTELGDGAPDGFAAAATAAVRELARLEDGSAELRGNQMTVSGLATTDVIADAVRKSLRERMPSGIRLVETIKFKGPAIPTFNPFHTAVDATADAVVLTGHVPTDAAKTALTETVKARLPGRRIDNRLEVGNGAPAGWQACMQYALAGLGRLRAGKAALTNRKLELTGDTVDETVHEALPGEIELAAGQSCDVNVDLKLRDIAEPNLGWKATRGSGQLLLEGEVPDDTVKAALLQEAGRLFPGYSIVDRTRPVATPSRRWRPVAETGLQQLARLRSGSAEIRNQQLTVSGDAAERGIAAAIHEQLTNRLAKGFTGRDVIEVRTDADIAGDEARRRAEAESRRRSEDEAEARRKAELAAEARRKEEADARRRQELAALEERKRTDEAEARRRAEQAATEVRRRVEIDRCQETLQRVTKAGVILFERASAEINATSHATLAELARTLKACPSVTIEIEGHTDIEGAPDRNQRLSERRAQSVLQHLTGLGADATRLVAVGYGQDKPVATNETADGRARNRRIEFTVKGK